MPAYADDVQVSKLADDNETEAEIAADIERRTPASEAPERDVPRPSRSRAEAPEAPVAEVAPEAPVAPEDVKTPAPRADANGAGANPESAERRKRNEGGGPNARTAQGAAAMSEGMLMAILVWLTMGIALWHFTVFLPDHFWQGIVGAFVGAVIGALRWSARSC